MFIANTVAQNLGLELSVLAKINRSNYINALLQRLFSLRPAHKLLSHKNT